MSVSSSRQALILRWPLACARAYTCYSKQASNTASVSVSLALHCFIPNLALSAGINWRGVTELSPTFPNATCLVRSQKVFPKSLLLSDIGRFRDHKFKVRVKFS